MAWKIPATLMATWLLIVPHALSGLVNVGGFFGIFFNAPFGIQFVAGVVVNLLMAAGAAVTCVALFDPGPFLGAIKVFWARIFAVLWNFLNGVWLVWLVYANEDGRIGMLSAQLALAVITFSVLMLYAVESAEDKTTRKEESRKAKESKS